MSCSIEEFTMTDLSTPNQRAWRRFRENKPAVFSAAFLSLLLLLVLAWPLLSPLTWDGISDNQFQRPGRMHWFGTDVHGRDLLTRMLYGARVSLLVGVIGAGVAIAIGVGWGAVAGYVGGRVDAVMMRCVDVFYSLPSIIFVIVLLTTLRDVTRRWLIGHFGAFGPKLAG